MKTPAFWSHTGILSTLLLPFAFLYETASTLRRAYTKPAQFPIPILCIGNLIAGGSGKTPVALHVGRLLKAKGVEAYFLTRGYGGKLAGPVLVDPKKHRAHEVGDEPLLLAQVLPTIVAKNRLEGARFALQKGARMIVMDDGFQNPTIAKTLSILVMDGKIGFGNGRLIPAGPLRERPRLALRRAHAAIILNRSTSTPPMPKELVVLSAKPQFLDATWIKGKKVFAFCGLAYPQKFFDMLTSAGAKMVGTSAFADHHPYNEMDMNKLLAQSITQGAALVTTAKDAVRIPMEYKECIAVVDMELSFDDPRLLDGIVDYLLNPS